MIAQSSIGVGFALGIPAVFLFAINAGLLSSFSIGSRFIEFISHLSVVLYLAWMGGVFTSEAKEFSTIVRGLLSTLFINIFSIAYLYKDLISFGKIHVLIFIILLNSLLAICGCQIGEKYSNKQIFDELGSKGEIFMIAVCLPFLFYGVLWMFILGAFQLMSL